MLSLTVLPSCGSKDSLFKELPASTSQLDLQVGGDPQINPGVNTDMAGDDGYHGGNEAAPRVYYNLPEESCPDGSPNRAVIQEKGKPRVLYVTKYNCEDITPVAVRSEDLIVGQLGALLVYKDKIFVQNHEQGTSQSTILYCRQNEIELGPNEANVDYTNLNIETILTVYKNYDQFGDKLHLAIWTWSDLQNMLRIGTAIFASYNASTNEYSGPGNWLTAPRDSLALTLGRTATPESSVIPASLRFEFEYGDGVVGQRSLLSGQTPNMKCYGR